MLILRIEVFWLILCDPLAIEQTLPMFTFRDTAVAYKLISIS
jgi:hypothetical protein